MLNKKLKKLPSKVAQKNSNPLFFLTAQSYPESKWKNSCSKLWLVNQLYIELGADVHNSASYQQLFPLPLEKILVALLLFFCMLLSCANMMEGGGGSTLSPKRKGKGEERDGRGGHSVPAQYTW